MKNCASCGMPLDESSKSKHSEVYCIYCQDQKTGKLASYEKVREGTIDATVKFIGKTKEEAEKMADEILPTLPRWKDRIKDNLQSDILFPLFYGWVFPRFPFLFLPYK